MKSYLNTLVSWHWFLITIIIVVSIYPRLWNLETNPPLIVDEPANIRDIDLILKNGINITDFHWDFSKSRVVHLLPVLLIKLGLEDHLIALRLSSAILSMLALIPFYFIARKLTNNWFAFCSTLLLSSSYYYLQFSRVGWTDVILNIFLGLSLFWLIMVIKEQKKTNFGLTILVGLIGSLIFYSYRSGIILLVVSLIFFLVRKTAKTELKHQLFNFFVYMFTLFLFSYPWITTVYKNPEKYNLRYSVVSISNIKLPNGEFKNKNELYASQIKRTLSSWLLLNKQTGVGQENPRYLPSGYPIVNHYVKIGFWVGFLVGLFHLKKTYPLYIIIFAGMAGQIWTVEPPNGARGLIMLPCIYLLFGLGIYKLYKVSGENKFVGTILILLSTVFSYLDVQFYTYWMSWINV